MILFGCIVDIMEQPAGLSPEDCFYKNVTKLCEFRQFADGVFKYRLLGWGWCISCQISLNIVPKGQNDNLSAFVEIMAWGRKLLFEPMLAS